MCLSLGSRVNRCCSLFAGSGGLDRSADSLQSGEETAGGSDVVGRPSMSERAEAQTLSTPRPGPRSESPGSQQ